METLRFQAKTLKALTGSILCVYFVGCGSAPSTSSISAAVSMSELNDAVRAVKSIDYLPFSQTQDGCYARALYMGMEIASRGIPASSQFAIATSGQLRPNTRDKWDYHVAPAVWVDRATEPHVLDPSLFDQVVLRSEWIRALNPSGSYELKFAPANNTISTSSQLTPGPLRRSDMIASLRELEKFTSSDITYSCRMMSSYIGSETDLSAAEIYEKQLRLTKRTKQLIKALAVYGLAPNPGEISDREDDCY